MNARLPFHTLLGFGLLALFASGTAHAELYKWVDDQGNVTYSQVAPPDREAKTIAPPPPPPESPAPAKKAETSGDSAASKKEAEENAKVDKEVERVAKRNCEIAKRNLNIYKTYARIRNEKDEIVALDDKTRAEKIKQTEKDIKDYCK